MKKIKYGMNFGQDYRSIAESLRSNLEAALLRYRSGEDLALAEPEIRFVRTLLKHKSEHEVSSVLDDKDMPSLQLLIRRLQTTESLEEGIFDKSYNDGVIAKDIARKRHESRLQLLGYVNRIEQKFLKRGYERTWLALWIAQTDSRATSVEKQRLSVISSVEISDEYPSLFSALEGTKNPERLANFLRRKASALYLAKYYEKSAGLLSIMVKRNLGQMEHLLGLRKVRRLPSFESMQRSLEHFKRDEQSAHITAAMIGHEKEACEKFAYLCANLLREITSRFSLSMAA